jgi:hypothetical protein
MQRITFSTEGAITNGLNVSFSSFHPVIKTVPDGFSSDFPKPIVNIRNPRSGKSLSLSWNHFPCAICCQFDLRARERVNNGNDEQLCLLVSQFTAKSGLSSGAANIPSVRWSISCILRLLV